MTDLIAPALDAHLAAINEEREPDGYWHPSSLFTCDRQAVYQVRGVLETDPKGGSDYRALAIGKALHELVQAAVTPASSPRIKRSWHEVKILIPTLRVKGSADSLVELVVQEAGEYEVEEFKSTKSESIKWTVRRDGAFKPKPEHVSQALTYVYAMRYFHFTTEHTDDMGVTHVEDHAPLGGKLSRARITYIGKDAGDIHEFTVEITPEWEQDFLAHIANLDRYREDGEALPPRLARDDKGKKHWLCAGYCGFRSRCWNTDGEGVEL